MFTFEIRGLNIEFLIPTQGHTSPSSVGPAGGSADSAEALLAKDPLKVGAVPGCSQVIGSTGSGIKRSPLTMARDYVAFVNRL